jgi:hypothetical protein
MFRSKIPFWKKKGSVRWCVVVMQRQFFCRQSSGGEVFAHFHAVAVKRHNSMRNWLFGLPWIILCVKAPWCQRKGWACSWLWSSPFSVSVSLEFSCTDHDFFPERWSNHCQGILAVSLRFAQSLMLFLCRLHCEIASGQKYYSKQKDAKNQHVHPTAWNFVHWPQRHASTTTYHCIALLQLL